MSAGEAPDDVVPAALIVAGGRVRAELDMALIRPIAWRHP